MQGRSRTQGSMRAGLTASNHHSSLVLLADGELVACADGLVVGEVDLKQFFALDLMAGFVFEGGDDAFGGGVDYVAGGGIGAAAVDAEGDPAGLIAQGDAGHLFGRHCGGVENVDAAVGGVGEPEFSFIRRERDAVAGAAVALGGTFLEASDFHAMEHLAGFAIADFKTKQLVDIDEAKGLPAVDGERAYGSTERPNLADYGVGFGVGNGKHGGLQTGEINARAIRSVDSVVRSGFGHDFGEHIAGERVDSVPVRALEGRYVKNFAVGGDGQAIGAAVVGFFPELGVGEEIEAGDTLGGADVELAGFGAGNDAFYIFGLLAGRDGPSGNALDDFVAGVDVVDEDADSAVFDIIANAGKSDIEEMLFV